MYDWANSAFATTVMAGFFPVFFKQYWSFNADATISTARLGLGNSIAGVMVALSAPILGAIADKGGTRKKFLLFFAVMGIIMTMGLYLVSRGNWPMAVLLYILATVGFSGGNIFYDALITGITTIDGVNTIIRMAVDYGISIGLDTRDLILALLMTQFVGFPSAIGFGFLGRKFGTKPAIFAAIAVYLFVSVWAAFMKNSTEFYVLAIIVGLVQGGDSGIEPFLFCKAHPHG